MKRFARRGRVFIFEEPVFTDERPRLDITTRGNNLFVVVPNLPHGFEEEWIPYQLRAFLGELLEKCDIRNYLSWYYTPMMFEWSRDFKPAAVVYDCMDQLSAFKNAPPELAEREAELLGAADLVFTGGRSLYEAKKETHPAVYAFPSSIDVEHFAQAASVTGDPPDMQEIARPRIGFVGVIDERMDTNLLEQIADRRPEWQFVMIGPVVKIEESDLPRRDNIHYLGPKTYEELPAYIGRWDVAMMPFAMNESTRYISPTKTPEYLAAGRPVVSTPIRDVVSPYGEKELVHIAATADEFVEGIEAALNEAPDERKEKVDAFLADMSWDSTFTEMWRLINAVLERPTKNTARFAKGAGSYSVPRSFGNRQRSGFSETEVSKQGGRNV